MKKWITALATATLILTAAGTASAHVTVSPKETTTGAYEKYTVRVPVEKDINTTKVRLEIPQGVRVSTVEPIPGWNYSFEKDADGYNKAITWTATNGGLKAGEFMEFPIIGANPKDVGTGTLAWKAYQTYADGTTVEWTGDASSKTPASVTTIKAAASKEEAPKTETPAATTTPTTTTSNTWPMILSGAALLLSLISLFRKRA